MILKLYLILLILCQVGGQFLISNQLSGTASQGEVVNKSNFEFVGKILVVGFIEGKLF